MRREGFSGERKIHTGTNDNLLEAILNQWEAGNISPAFICEGTEENKREAISSCNYFERVFFEVLPSLEETLVVYGWGFGKQDQHIIDQIGKSTVRKIAVAIYGDDDVLCGKIEQKLKALNLDKLVFFDSTSDGCWNNPVVETVEQEGVA